MKTVYKYQITRTGKIRLPIGAKIVHTDKQNGEIFIWCLVDTDALTEKREFCVMGTGWDLGDEPFQYIGTVPDGHGYVWHVIEVFNV